MTGPEHYASAERYRAKAQEAQNAAYDGSTEDGWEKAAYFNAAAQVHATLALAAATADQSRPHIDGFESLADADRAWAEAIR